MGSSSETKDSESSSEGAGGILILDTDSSSPGPGPGSKPATPTIVRGRTLTTESPCEFSVTIELEGLGTFVAGPVEVRPFKDFSGVDVFAKVRLGDKSGESKTEIRFAASGTAVRQVIKGFVSGLLVLVGLKELPQVQQVTLEKELSNLVNVHRRTWQQKRLEDLLETIDPELVDYFDGFHTQLITVDNLFAMVQNESPELRKIVPAVGPRAALVGWAKQRAAQEQQQQQQQMHANVSNSSLNSLDSQHSQHSQHRARSNSMQLSSLPLDMNQRQGELQAPPSPGWGQADGYHSSHTRTPVTPDNHAPHPYPVSVEKPSGPGS